MRELTHSLLSCSFYSNFSLLQGCTAVSEYRRLLVSEHGRLDGASTEAIKVK